MAFSDDFSNYTQGECLADGTSFGDWTSAFSGFGCTSIVDNDGTAALSLSPKASTSDGETHSALVLGPNYEGKVDFACQVTTAQQLRQGGPPNAWEAAWVVWNYTDNTHFYYFIGKTIGWELGKEDPAYNGSQRFLKTGDAPEFPLGTPYQFEVQQNGNTMTILVNGDVLTTFTDDERPYTSGHIGFYCEDSVALYSAVSASGP